MTRCADSSMRCGRWWEARKLWGTQYIVVKQLLRLLISTPLVSADQGVFAR